MKYLLFISIFLGIHLSLYAYSQPIKISGKADFLKEGDTVTVSIYKYGLVYLFPPFQTDISIQSKNHSFQFNLPSSVHPYCINIAFKNNGQHNLLNYFVEASDNVKLNFQHGNLTISGAKSNGFDIQYKIRQFQDAFLKSGKMPHFSQSEPKNLARNFIVTDSLAKIELEMLRRHKSEISKNLYDILKTDIHANWAGSEYSELNYFSGAFDDSIPNAVMISYRKYLTDHPAPRVNASPMSIYCGTYISYLLEKYKVDSCLIPNRKFQVTDCLIYFAKKYSGILREQLFACVIAETKMYPEELREVIDHELVNMKNQDYRAFLKNVEDTRIDGAKAYNFTLQDIQRKPVQLRDFRGYVVVLDFWFTGCINCQELAPFMKEIEKEFVKAPVKFISISIDKNRDQWLKSIHAGTYTSPDIENLYTGGEGIKNIVVQNYHVDSFPTLVLVNKDGKVVNVRIDPRNDNGDALKKQIIDCLN